jgi:hypothetical protein
MSLFLFLGLLIILWFLAWFVEGRICTGWSGASRVLDWFCQGMFGLLVQSSSSGHLYWWPSLSTLSSISRSRPLSSVGIFLAWHLLGYIASAALSTHWVLFRIRYFHLSHTLFQYFLFCLLITILHYFLLLFNIVHLWCFVCRYINSLFLTLITWYMRVVGFLCYCSHITVTAVPFVAVA